MSEEIKIPLHATIDPDTGSIYIYIVRGSGKDVFETAMLRPGVNVDLDKEGNILGIEIL